ncbi:hypothetical protein DL89DRAFT_269833, partial [Linderina pennispora]
MNSNNITPQDLPAYMEGVRQQVKDRHASLESRQLKVGRIIIDCGVDIEDYATLVDNYGKQNLIQRAF